MLTWVVAGAVTTDVPDIPTLDLNVELLPVFLGDTAGPALFVFTGSMLVFDLKKGAVFFLLIIDDGGALPRRLLIILKGVFFIFLTIRRTVGGTSLLEDGFLLGNR